MPKLRVEPQISRPRAKIIHRSRKQLAAGRDPTAVGAEPGYAAVVITGVDAGVRLVSNRIDDLTVIEAAADGGLFFFP